MNADALITFTTAMLAIPNPIGSVAIFAGLVSNRSDSEHHSIAIRCCIAIAGDRCRNACQWIERAAAGPGRSGARIAHQSSAGRSKRGVQSGQLEIIMKDGVISKTR